MRSEVNQSPPSSAKVKNKCSLHDVDRESFTFTFIILKNFKIDKYSHLNNLSSVLHYVYSRK
jgi:hypothetical protein